MGTSQAPDHHPRDVDTHPTRNSNNGHLTLALLANQPEGRSKVRRNKNRRRWILGHILV